MNIDLPGGLKIQGLDDKQSRFSLLLWGPAGCGKTTLASTAPGKILWINFDPDGTDSLRGISEWEDKFLILDLSSQKHSITQKFKTDDGLGIGKILADPEHNIQTVVVDSLTAYSQLAVEAGIDVTKGATLERPSPGAYGARNALTLRMIQAILRLTAQHNKNVIFITHEDAPVTNDEGAVLYITMQLGGKLPDQAALQISEVWFMNDTGKERRIAVRPVRARKPMKSRMFDTSDSKYNEFIWPYQTNKPDPKYEIATWINEWKAAGGKIQTPR